MCLEKGYQVIIVGWLPHPTLTQLNHLKLKKLRKKSVQSPNLCLFNFGEKSSQADFSLVYSKPTPSQMVTEYEEFLNKMVVETFPIKTIIVSADDQVFFNEELRALKRSRLREYNRHGKSHRYDELQKKFDSKFQNEFRNSKEKIELEVTQGKRGSTYSAIKKLGLRPGELPQPRFQLPEHARNLLSSAESAEIMADYFSHVSQEYSPLDITSLPPNVQTYLAANPPDDVIPQLSVYDVYCKITSSKKPNSSVPGDLPKKVVQKYPALLAVPCTVIFNTITHSSVYPEQWKTEHQIPVPKCYPPESEDDLRNIAKTPFMSKVYESFIAGWLLPIIQPFLDPGQCGGLKGLPVTHYLIKLLEFVHSTWDKRQPHAVLAACVDLSKAFNRVDHSLVIQDLHDMHTPQWLLKIIISYLSNRSMILSYNGESSSRKILPGGGLQGANLGGIIFIVKYNGAFLRPPVPRNIIGPVTKSKAQKVKFVDDGSVAVSVDLKSSLIKDPVERQRPLNLHERTGHVLPAKDNLLQYYLEDSESLL